MHNFRKIHRVDIFNNVSIYYILLIGGPHFSIFLIDSFNKDALSAVYRSLISRQTLLECQYLLFPRAIIV